MPEETSTTATTPVVLDPSHDLYLHYSDSHSSSLASQKLRGDNYPAWRRSSEITLMAKNKLRFVLGKVPRPTENDSLLLHWERCNSMIISWLLHSIEPEIVESVLYCDTASQIWTELEERYDTSSGVKIFQVQKQFNELSQGDLSVTEFYTRCKKIWDQYMSLISLPVCSCGASNAIRALIENLQLMQFLLGLNDDYITVRGNILIMKPLPTLSQAYGLILQEEQQRNVRATAPLSVDSTALASQRMSTSGYQAQSPRYNQYHQRNPLPQTYRPPYQGQPYQNSSSQNRNRPFCNYCRKPGHLIDNCFKLQRNKAALDKGKKVAATVHTGDSFGSGGNDSNGMIMTPFCEVDTATQSQNPIITPEMYSQLVNMINKFNMENESSSSTSVPNQSGAAFFAGSFNEGTSAPW